MVLTPGRLNLHEDGLVAIQLKGSGSVGSFDGKGAFVPAVKGNSEANFEEDFIASLRVLSRGQVTLLVPVVETYQRQQGYAEGGGAIGDVQVNARWDAYLTGASLVIPGVAVLASLILPTGVPVEDATHRLSTDTTGTGTLQAGFGLALEQTYGNVLVNVTGSTILTSARNLGGVHTALGPSFGVSGALGYAFPGPVVALTASYMGSLESRIDGAAQPDSARTQLVLGVAAGYTINDAWRIQGGVFADPPVAHASQNQPTASVGASATLFRTW
jgi:hypothetical protein